MHGRLTVATLAAIGLVLAGCASADAGRTSAPGGTPPTTATGRGTPTGPATGGATDFTGRVTAAATGRGLSGIRVDVYQAHLAGNTDDAFPIVSTATRADGTYRLELPMSKVSPSGLDHQVVLCVFSLEDEYGAQCSPGLRWAGDGGVIPAASRRYAADPGARYRFDAVLGTASPAPVLPTATVLGRVTARDDGAGVRGVRVTVIDVAKARRKDPLASTIVGFTTRDGGSYSGTVRMADPYSRTIPSRRVAVCFEILGNDTTEYQAVCSGGRPTNALGYGTVEHATQYTLRPGQTLTVDQELDP